MVLAASGPATHITKSKLAIWRTVQDKRKQGYSEWKTSGMTYWENERFAGFVLRTKPAKRSKNSGGQGEIPAKGFCMALRNSIRELHMYLFLRYNGCTGIQLLITQGVPIL